MGKKKSYYTNKAKEEAAEKKRFQLTTADKAFLIALITLAVAMTVVGIMQRCGISLINGGLYMYGAFVGLVLMLAWGALFIFRKMKSKGARIAVGTLLVVVLFLLISICATYVSLIVSISIPKEYNMVRHGDHELVILRGYDPDLDRQDARKAARLAADPEGDPEFIVDDMGYCYYAYPRVLGFFYRSNADAEGDLYVNYEGEGQLMVEWPDENTAHLFIDHPEANEGGDWYVRFN